jgi:hypothetical protein
MYTMQKHLQITRNIMKVKLDSDKALRAFY